MSAEVINLPAVVVKRDLVLSPVMDLDHARSRMKEFQEFVAHYLEPSKDGGQDGGDYGAIPGAGTKKVLFKSGADKLTELYGLYDEYELDAKEDFDTKLFYYKVKCVLRSRRDDSIVGTGVGSCSTYESKYRWRDAQRSCPKCKASAIIKGKDEYGGGWLCWAKKGGCGGKFKDGDAAIESQKLDRIENPDIMDTVNTVLKMAKKRAKLDAVIGVTRSSGIFTQDLEDVPMPPAKPAVERTTEDIPLAAPQKSAAVDGNQTVKGEAGPEKAAAGEATPEFIDSGRQANFARAFKDALPKAKQAKAEDLRHEWLLNQGYINDEGPTSKLIRIGKFDAEKARACEWAAKQ